MGLLLGRGRPGPPIPETAPSSPSPSSPPTLGRLLPRHQGRPGGPARPPRHRPHSRCCPRRHPRQVRAHRPVCLPLLLPAAPTDAQLALLDDTPHRIIIVCLCPPPAQPNLLAYQGDQPLPDVIPLNGAASPPPTAPPSTSIPRRLAIPAICHGRLTIRTSFIYTSAAAANLHLPGQPPSPTSSSTSSATSTVRRLTTTTDTVLVSIEMDERWASSWAEAAQGPRSLKQRLLPLLPPPHQPLDVFSLATKGDLVGQRVLRATARIPAAALDATLAKSGHTGLFVRPFRTDGPSPHSIIWLPDLNLAAALQQAATLPSALGLVPNARGLGVRVRSNDYAAAYAALRQTSPPAPVSYYELAGAPPDLTANALAAALQTQGWTATPLRTFMRSGRRHWIIQSATTPTFSLLHTADGIATLQPARDRPRPPTAWQRVARPTATASTPATSPPQQPSVAPPPAAPSTSSARPLTAAPAKRQQSARPPLRGSPQPVDAMMELDDTAPAPPTAALPATPAPPALSAPFEQRLRHLVTEAVQQALHQALTPLIATFQQQMDAERAQTHRHFQLLIQQLQRPASAMSESSPLVPIAPASTPLAITAPLVDTPAVTPHLHMPALTTSTANTTPQPSSATARAHSPATRTQPHTGGTPSKDAPSARATSSSNRNAFKGAGSTTSSTLSRT